jgi:hypothetical protein
MRLPQSQNWNENNMCLVGNPVRMISEQGGVYSCPRRLCVMLTIYFLIM